MQNYIGTKRISAQPMTRLDYNDYRNWLLPSNEDGDDAGYLVEYLDSGESNDPRHDGCISWSPKEQFENAHQTSGNMSSGHAVVLMKAGLKTSRAGWKGKGMWVIYNPGSNGETHAMAEGSVYKNHGINECIILPHFDMYTVNADGRWAMLPGWLASQSDLDALDWGVVD